MFVVWSCGCVVVWSFVWYRRGWEAAMSSLAQVNPKQRESKEIDLNLNIDEKYVNVLIYRIRVYRLQ